MCMYVDAGDIVACYFAHCISSNSKNKFVSYSALNEYARQIAAELQKKGENVLVAASGDDFYSFFLEYPHFFQETTEKGVYGLTMKNSLTPRLLAKRFLSTLPPSFIDAADSVPAPRPY